MRVRSSLSGCLLVSVLTALTACGDAREDENVSTGFTATGPTTSATGDGDGDGDGDGGDKFDVGDGKGTAGDGGEAAGCDKVDFLFVVDNSGSMQDEQANLINSFPGFIDTISQTLDAQDYHIMAVSTDNGVMTGLNSMCINGDCSCTPAPVCCEQACNGYATTCNGFDCNNLPIGECDKKYGAGQTFDADGNSCQLADDRRYMVDGQANVEQTFECIASVGTYGSGDEKPMHAMSEAVSDAMNDPGGCDESFLRDDAILVVTFITDEEDDHGQQGEGSPGEPSDWAQSLIAAKAGNDNAVVVLGLFGDSDDPNGICPPGADPNNGGNGAEPAPRLRAFTESFEHGVVGSVCAADYAPFFVEAVSVIDATCEEFVPPG